MDRYQRLVVPDPQVMIGKPVIAGARYRELTLEKLAARETGEQIPDARHRPTTEAVRAALAFAAEALRSKVACPLGGTAR